MFHKIQTKLLLFFTILFFPTFCWAALGDNITNYWAFNESSGNAADSVGSATLTNTGTATYTTGKIGNSGTTNGTSQYFTKGSHLTSIEGGSYTISFWFKRHTTIGDNDQLLSQDVLGSRGMWVRYGTSGINWLQFFGADTGSIDSGAVSNDTWYHLALVYESIGAGTSKMTMYLNGSSVGTPLTNVGSSPNTTTASFMTQAWAVSGTVADYLDGQIDELGVWNRALSSSEVTALYNGGSGFAYPFSTPTPTPTASSTIVTTIATSTVPYGDWLFINSLLLFCVAFIPIGTLFSLIPKMK